MLKNFFDLLGFNTDAGRIENASDKWFQQQSPSRRTQKFDAKHSALIVAPMVIIDIPAS